MKDQSLQLLIDVNVWVDLFDDQRPQHVAARKLIETHIANGFRLTTTDACISTTIYVLQQAKVSNETLVSQWTSVLGFVDVVSASAQQILAAFERIPKDLEDALLYAACIEHNLDGIATNDAKFIAVQPSICKRVEVWNEMLNALSP